MFVENVCVHFGNRTGRVCNSWKFGTECKQNLSSLEWPRANKHYIKIIVVEWSVNWCRGIRHDRKIWWSVPRVFAQKWRHVDFFKKPRGHKISKMQVSFRNHMLRNRVLHFNFDCVKKLPWKLSFAI